MLPERPHFSCDAWKQPVLVTSAAHWKELNAKFVKLAVAEAGGLAIIYLNVK